MVHTNQNYELYFIVSPELDAREIDSQIEKVVSLLTTEVEANNIQIDKQGLKKLAYSVDKCHTGFYILITFDVVLGKGAGIKNIEKKLNIDKSILRYIIVNRTEFLVQQAKEKIVVSNILTHNELNKKARKPGERKCVIKHTGVKAIDYKNVDFLSQFTSPYAKIFHRDKTGTSAKYQRKITRAIKMARHMALMPFTPQD